MSFRVIRPGLLTTVQDRGRRGHQRIGVSCGGAMDEVALRTANLLVGNCDTAAALEATLVGPTLEFEADTLIAICGARLDPRVAEHSIPNSRPVWLPAGATLTLGAATHGARCMLAVAGGIDVPLVLGSRSTHLLAGFGGFYGRALLAGDRIDTGPPSSHARLLMANLSARASGHPFATTSWFAAEDVVHRNDSATTLRVIRGPQFDRLEPEAQGDLLRVQFEVTNQSNRMGYRLSGPPLRLADRSELISEAVCMGTVQLTPQGQAILLMADCATTGGYAKIANVIAVDLPRAAQLRPGSTIRFEEITLDEALGLYRECEERLRRMSCGFTLQVAALRS